MRSILFLVLVMQTSGLLSQKEVTFDNSPLLDVLRDLEDIHSLRFSYNNDYLSQKRCTYAGTSELVVILAEIGEQCSLEFIHVDNENIVIRPSNRQYFLNDTVFLREFEVVTEYLTSGFDQNKEDGSIIIDPNGLAVLPGLTEPDVMQSLQMIPGISSPSETASNLNIRGGSPDQNLVLYDNIKMYHHGHLFGMISAFNPYIIAQVDVYRSGTSPRYGERISGVVDIKGPSDVPERLNGGFGANMLHSDIFIRTPLIKDKLGLVVSGRRALTDLVSSSTYDSYSNKVFQNTRIEEVEDIIEEEELEVTENTLSFSDINAKLLLRPSDKHYIGISGIRLSNGVVFQSVDSEEDMSTQDLELSNMGASIEWSASLNDEWTTSLELHASEYSSNNAISFSNQEIVEELQSRGNLIEDSGGSVRGEYSAGTSQWSLGYDLTRYSVEYRLLATYEEDEGLDESNRTNEDIHSVFIEYKDRLGPLSWSAGTRSSIYSQLGSTFMEPRFYMEYEINDDLKLKSSAEIKNQAISQLVNFEFNDLQFSNALWVLADEEDIPVLNNRQATFGFIFDKNDWHIDVEGYGKSIRGLTSFTRGFSNTISEDYTEGTSTVVGIDLLIKKKIGRFRSWFAYSLSRNDFLFSGIQDDKFPGNYDQRHILSFSGSYRIKQLQFSLGWQYGTGLPFSDAIGIEFYTNDEDDEEAEVEYGDQNNTRLDDYHRFDGSVTYDFYLGEEKRIRSRIGASLANIYDRTNFLSKEFFLDENEDEDPQIVEQTEAGLGRTVNFVLRIWF